MLLIWKLYVVEWPIAANINCVHDYSISHMYDVCTGGSVVPVGRIGGIDLNMSSLSLDQIQAADFTFLKKLMDLRKVLVFKLYSPVATCYHYRLRNRRLRVVLVSFMQ